MLWRSCVPASAKFRSMTEPGKKNRPPLYVEAYVPIVDGHGGVRGVVEVYIDQTKTASLLKTSFAALSLGLALVAALTFGLPMMAYLLRSRQASEARQRGDYLAHYEPMTGLLNRASFTDKLDSTPAGKRSRPEPCARPVRHRRFQGDQRHAWT